MYAVVDILGFQYKLSQGEKLHVPKVDVDAGGKIQFSNVLLIADGDAVTVGTPFIADAVVEATVATHEKHPKVIVFKKRRREDYSVKKGHRQDFTEIIIDSIKVGCTVSEESTSVNESEAPEQSLKSGRKSAKSRKAAKTAEGNIVPEIVDEISSEDNHAEQNS